MFEYVPVYNLFVKYVTDELERLPAITDPTALTRDGVAELRARTARFDVVRLDVERFVAPARDVTLREELLAELEGVATARDLTALLAVARDLTVPDFDAVVRDVVVPDFDAEARDVTVPDCLFTARVAVVRVTFARVFCVARGLTRPVRTTVSSAVTIGSANTERIETNVEQTKKVAANKNTVPIAFFSEFTFMRILIEISCYITYATMP